MRPAFTKLLALISIFIAAHGVSSCSKNLLRPDSSFIQNIAEDEYDTFNTCNNLLGNENYSVNFEDNTADVKTFDNAKRDWLNKVVQTQIGMLNDSSVNLIPTINFLNSLGELYSASNENKAKTKLLNNKLQIRLATLLVGNGADLASTIIFLNSIEELYSTSKKNKTKIKIKLEKLLSDSSADVTAGALSEIVQNFQTTNSKSLKKGLKNWLNNLSDISADHSLDINSPHITEKFSKKLLNNKLQTRLAELLSNRGVDLTSTIIFLDSIEKLHSKDISIDTSANLSEALDIIAKNLQIPENLQIPQNFNFSEEIVNLLVRMTNGYDRTLTETIDNISFESGVSFFGEFSMGYKPTDIIKIFAELQILRPIINSLDKKLYSIVKKNAKQIIYPIDITRHACSLYQKSINRPRSTQILLKSLIRTWSANGKDALGRYCTDKKDRDESS